MRRTASLGLALAAGLSACPALAQDGPGLTIATNPELGRYLADGTGHALYLLEKDRDDRGGRTAGGSTCYNSCVIVWPPYIASEAPTGGPGVDGGLIGTIQRTDGTVQVTYGGWPVYYYVADLETGDVLGHDVDDAWGDWYLISPAGDQIED